MNVNIEQIRLFNRCPLLLKQMSLYQKAAGLSRTFFAELSQVFNSVLYQRMRGRKMNLERVMRHWKAIASKVEKAHPNASRSEYDFPSQCLAVFLDSYFKPSKEDVLGLSVPFVSPISPNVVVEDTFPILTQTPYGTRITVLTMFPEIPPELVVFNDITYTIYAHAYRRELGKNEFAVTVHNLGDGKRYDIIRKVESYQRHLILLEQLAGVMYSDYVVPTLTACAGCPIKGTCHVRQHNGTV